jgi:hypothetical protein
MELASAAGMACTPTSAKPTITGNRVWEAGGVTLAALKILKVEHSYSYHKRGPGFWTDIGSQYVLYDGDRTGNNEIARIPHEISYDATITNTYIAYDGYSPYGSTLS